MPPSDVNKTAVLAAGDWTKSGSGSDALRPENVIVILVIDSRPWSREAHVQALNSAGRDLYVEGYATPAEVAQTEAETRSAVVMLNLDGMPLGDERVLEVCREAQACLPHLPRVVVSDSSDITEIVNLMHHDVRGYVPISLELQQVVDALRFVAAGGVFIPAEAVVAGLENQAVRSLPLPPPNEPKPNYRQRVTSGSPARPKDGDVPATERLTPRERSVLNELREGKSNKLIARELGITEATVKVHVRHVMRKFGVANRTQLALRIESVDPNR